MPCGPWEMLRAVLRFGFGFAEMKVGRRFLRRIGRLLLIVIPRQGVTSSLNQVGVLVNLEVITQSGDPSKVLRKRNPKVMASPLTKPNTHLLSLPLIYRAILLLGPESKHLSGKVLLPLPIVLLADPLGALSMSETLAF